MTNQSVASPAVPTPTVATSEWVYAICRDCGGTGEVWSSTCRNCWGEGELLEEVSLPCCMWCEQPTDGDLTRVIDWQDNVDSICQSCLADAKSDPDAYGNARALDRQVAA